MCITFARSLFHEIRYHDIKKKGNLQDSLKGALKMKVFIHLALLLLPCLVIATDGQNCSEECIGEERPVKFRCPPSYKNSVVYDPIEREPIVMRPSSHESSFYEQMTR